MWLSTRAALILATVAVAAFHLAYQVEAAGGLILVYLACLFRLAWVKTTRWAFYLGLGIGFAVAAPQLFFFFDIFLTAALGLWLIFGLWIAFFLLISRMSVERWPRWGALWLPVIWLALEYFRSELYYLRFAWLTPGIALSHPLWNPYAWFGVYGFSFVALVALAWIWISRGWLRGVAIAAALLLLITPQFVPTSPHEKGPLIVGIQLEGQPEHEQFSTLLKAFKAHPAADIFVFSEYSFGGQVPEQFLKWCRDHEKYLIAGGRESIEHSSQYYNTAFVISPAGEVVFQQVKSVPIQFFKDGLPAESQQVWESPWGKIGIAICYDLSYARVMDRLVEFGAQALIIPTMDAISWGEHEHALHTKVAPVRAREYGLAIFRVASSGISQRVDSGGEVLATAPYPGQGELIFGELAIARSSHLPLDRYLAMPAVIALATLLAYLAYWRMIIGRSTTASNSRRGRPFSSPNNPRVVEENPFNPPA